MTDPTDREIEALLAQCPASFAQQTTGWRDVIRGIDRDEPMFLACRSGGKLIGLLPGYRFEGPQGAILTSVPQAGPLGGIVCHPAADRAAVYQALLEGYLSLARESGCDLATLITNPFWPDRDLVARTLRPDYVLENSLLALDLSLDCNEDGTPPGASASLRRNLRRARATGLVVDEEQTRENVLEWVAIHQARHRAIGATPLPRALFLGALEHMVSAGHARFFFVRLAQSGDMAAGGLYLCHGDVVDAFMPSLASEHADLRPGHLLAAHTIDWARRRGARFYNWQGSPPAGGVERFKRQWGSHDYGYAFATRITGDATRYLQSSVASLVEGYPWHYVLPFDRVGGAIPSDAAAASTRAEAWGAREASG